MSEPIEQGTEAWRQARSGLITASDFADAISIIGGGEYKSGPKKGQPIPMRRPESGERLMRRLAFERRSGRPVHEISSKSMSWGKDVEQFAREAFEFETGLLVAPGGFQTHPQYPFIGASPDGIIDGVMGYESKCPHDETVHINTILNGMPEDHIAQIQGGMLVTGLDSWWFCSYDPRQREEDRLYRQLVPRDNRYIEDVLLPGLLQFEGELRAMVNRLDQRIAA